MRKSSWEHMIGTRQTGSPGNRLAATFLPAAVRAVAELAAEGMWLHRPRLRQAFVASVVPEPRTARLNQQRYLGGAAPARALSTRPQAG